MPLKRHTSLQDFSREHHEELLLGWKIRRGLASGIDPERISRYCKHFFDFYLSKHMEKEEKYIFSKLPPSDVDAVRLKREHQEVKQIIGGLGQDRVNTLEFLKILAHDLEKHIRYEERVFFERLQNELSPEILESMKPDEEQIREGLEWEDTFW